MRYELSCLNACIKSLVEGLFQRAIVSSGSAVSPWLIDNSPVKATQEIIRILGCNLYQIDSLQCLRSKPAESLLRAYEEYTEVCVW